MVLAQPPLERDGHVANAGAAAVGSGSVDIERKLFVARDAELRDDRRDVVATFANSVVRLESDLEYIRRQSLQLDLKIMVMTIVREIRSKRAF